jgi:tyrosine-protein kinase Etk/Wzc
MDNKLHEEEEESKGIDIKRLLLKLRKNFLWFVMTLAFFMSAAYLVLRYTVPLYQVSTYIVIKQPSDNIALLGGSPFAAAGSNGVATNGSDPGNEIFKLQSSTLVGKVVDSLRLFMEVGKKGSVRNKAIDLGLLPFDIKVGRQDRDAKNVVYELDLQDKFYQLKEKSNVFAGKYNEPLVVKGDTVTIIPKQPINSDSYVFQLHSRSNTVEKYLSRLKVAPATKTAVGLLEVTLNDELPGRAKKFIDVLIASYDRENLEFSNQSLRKEMDFLNERLVTVKQELEQQENTVRDFKVQNKVTEVSAKANQLLGNLSVIDSKKNDNELKRNYLKLVEANIRDFGSKGTMIASVGGVEDAALAGKIEKYNQLIAEKKKIQEDGAPKDPRLPAINAQLEDARINIGNAVKNARKEINASDNFLASQEATTAGRFSTMPAKEKDYVQVNRVLNIKQSLYNFLLQRKEDKNIQLASSEIAESRIVDSRLSSVQTPKPLIVYAIAFLAGLILPAVVIFIRFFVNNKIETRKDVELLTSLPIAGEIGRVEKSGDDLVITAEASSSEAEQFRTLRTNISYRLQGTNPKVLLVTSSVSKEGKSFVSLNLASGLAITNKKVLLLDFDLRDPGLSKKLGLENTQGITNVLTGEAEISSMIRPYDHSKNLFFISSGSPLRPNTSELILSEQMEFLFAYARQHFDVVILDTPPVAPVSDALVLSKWADMSFFVIRHKYTSRSAVKLINKLHEEHKLPSVTLIINGIEDKKEYSYGNDYSYGYGYTTDTKKVKKLLRPKQKYTV